MKLLKRLFRDEEGATMIEYALLAALISVIAILAITDVGEAVLATFEAIAGSF